MWALSYIVYKTANLLLQGDYHEIPRQEHSNQSDSLQHIHVHVGGTSCPPFVSINYMHMYVV